MIDLDNLLIYVVLPLLIGVAASIIAHFIIRFWEREHPVQQRRMIILAVAVVVILLAAFIIPSVSPQLSITIPHDNDQVSLQDTGTGGYIFTINGTSRNINRENQDILVWVEPVQPSSPEGWYLQCPPYGIVNREGDGSWVGKGVI